MTKKKLPILALALLALGLAGCQTANKSIMDAGGESQVKLRAMQTRYFETDDKEMTLRSTIATLQDLGFIVDKADLDLGSVSATKLNGYQLRMTVTAMPRKGDQMVVRANAQYNIQPVDDPQPYQQFFDALSKSMFLTAHVDE